MIMCFQTILLVLQSYLASCTTITFQSNMIRFLFYHCQRRNYLNRIIFFWCSSRIVPPTVRQHYSGVASLQALQPLNTDINMNDSISIHGFQWVHLQVVPFRCNVCLISNWYYLDGDIRSRQTVSLKNINYKRVVTIHCMLLIDG